MANTVWDGMVWYGMVWYGMVWDGMGWYWMEGGRLGKAMRTNVNWEDDGHLTFVS